MATEKDILMCTKWNKRMMGKSHPQKFGKEYFAHCCHNYFGVNELVNQWNYDAGDLFDPTPWYVEPEWLTRMIQVVDAYTEKVFPLPDTFEMGWSTKYERNLAYQMVQRMFLDIPEYDDYADMLDTQEDALGIGLQ